MWLGIEIKEDVARKRKLKRMWLGIEIKGCGSEEEIKEDVARKRKLLLFVCYAKTTVL